MKLHETPIFAQIKKEGLHSKSPLKETFGNCQNVSVMLIVLFGALAGQAAVSYAGHIYVFYFMIQTLKVLLKI